MLHLTHPFKSEIQAIRSAILGASATITEGIKWNTPSFRTSEYFATIHLREKNGIGVVLHLGAKVREVGPGGIWVEDPVKLLKWLGKDRAMIVFKDMSDFQSKREAFEEVICRWIPHV